jgi:ubiquinone/menaquinone biosynthesis C-methylase UbiE
MAYGEHTLTKVEVVQVYERTAPFYDLWARLAETRARQRALELARVRDGESVLEVAVGTGLAFAELLQRNPNGRNEGIDLTEAMLAKAREKAERSLARSWRLRVGDAYHLDFPAATFDLLLNCYMFDLLPEGDFGSVLREFHRVLKPGGRLVLVNLAPGDGVISWLWSHLHRINPAWVGGCRGVQLVGHIREAGFAISNSQRVSQFGVPSEVIVAEKTSIHSPPPFV